MERGARGRYSRHVYVAIYVSWRKRGYDEPQDIPIGVLVDPIGQGVPCTDYSLRERLAPACLGLSPRFPLVVYKERPLVPYIVHAEMGLE